jgi:hypothetical protein
MKRTLQLLLLVALSSSGAIAQINCSSGPAAQKLVCQIPFATGLLTNDKALGAQGQTSPTAVQAATIFNSAIATQVSQLPLSTASAGTVLVYKNGIPETFNNLGPILTDRAQVIGRGKVFIGFTASQYVFTDIDGISLGSLAFGFQSQARDSAGNLISTTFTTETTKLAFKVNQFISIATVGISKRVDASVIVPAERVSLGATTFNSRSYIESAGSNTATGPISNPSVLNAGTASGIGDLLFNVKSVLVSGEHATFSAGMNFRAPTGDDRNFLGSGAVGYNPYLAYSFLAKISPHAKIGYQWNTKTELNYQVNSSTGIGDKHSLPGGMQYDVGADWALAKRVTIAADLLGSQYLNAPIVVTQSSRLATTSGAVSLNTSAAENSAYSLSNLSTGVKLNPFKNLVISANLLTQLNNVGLRSRPTPLLGLSYKF